MRALIGMLAVVLLLVCVAALPAVAVTGSPPMMTVQAVQDSDFVLDLQNETRVTDIEFLPAGAGLQIWPGERHPLGTKLQTEQWRRVDGGEPPPPPCAPHCKPGSS